MKYVFLTILALFILSACVTQGYTPEHSDASVYKISTMGLDCNQLTVATQAAEDWNLLTNKSHQIILVDEDIPDRIVVQKCPDGDQWDGSFNWDGQHRHIYACDHGTDYVRLWQILAHEMGHMIGLRHLCEPPSPGAVPPCEGAGVMAPDATGTTISPADVTECKMVAACDP